MSIRISGKMTDNEILDELAECFSEEAAEKFGCSLSDPDVLTTQQKIEILNGILKEVGSQLSILSLFKVESDGYVWRVERTYR